MRASWMTYGVLKDLSRADLLDLLSKNGFEGVEFRTDAKQGHGVEASLNADERKQVIADCDAAGIKIISVASGNSYHHPDASELRRHIDETKARMNLAKDLGAPRVRVFGNNFPKEIPREKTLAQVTDALREICDYGKGVGVKTSLELHGEFDWQSTSKIAQDLNHDNLGLIWNSVSSDIVDGSLEKAIDTVWPWLDHVHVHDLAGQGYPYRELFQRLHDKGYDGYMSAEAERRAEHPAGDLPMFVAYYADLWRAYRDLARS